MAGINITLLRNKDYTSENSEENKIIAGENNATSIIVHFPEEYADYSKRVEFMNIRREKWAIGLYMPEDTTKHYDENFDKLNFSFTLPNPVTVNGEMKMQFVAYLADETETIVPFEIIRFEIRESILYVKKQASENPDLVIKAYEYANMSLETAREANERSKHAEDLTLDAAESARNAEQSAKNAENSAQSANTSAQNSSKSASEAQKSATAAQNSASASAKSASDAAASASNAEQLADTANTKSTNAVNTSNDANAKATKSLEIVENLTVSSEELDCEEHVAVNIETNSTNKHKNIKFSIPAPKKGTSYRSKGVWSSQTQYINDQYFIDTVALHGCTYYCKQSHTNQQPVASADSEYWGLLAAKGSDAGFTIVDNLESDHSDYVLSAKQGKVLKELISSSIETAISNLIDQAPANLNTLKKIATAINNDPNFYSTITKSITDNVQSLENKLTSLEQKLTKQIADTKAQLEQSQTSTKNELVQSINDLQQQINNMLNGTTIFTLLKANTVDLV